MRDKAVRGQVGATVCPCTRCLGFRPITIKLAPIQEPVAKSLADVLGDPVRHTAIDRGALQAGQAVAITASALVAGTDGLCPRTRGLIVVKNRALLAMIRVDADQAEQRDLGFVTITAASTLTPGPAVTLRAANNGAILGPGSVISCARCPVPAASFGQ